MGRRAKKYLAYKVKKIRYAFSHFELPNFSNFQSFFRVGQAVNVMYLDLSLWPFVLLTMGFPPVHQVAAIKLLIIYLNNYRYLFQSTSSKNSFRYIIIFFSITNPF